MTATATPTPTSTRISAAELRQLIHDNDSIRVLDVRTGGEFESVHIPGSLNVPLGTLNEHASEIADVDQQVVLVCQSGARASEACTKLTDNGKDALQVLDGGIAAWQQSGGDVVRGQERWGMERQVRLAAGGIVVAGVIGSTLLPTAKWLAAGVGAGLAYSALSNTCTMAQVLAKLPYNQSDEPDVEGVIAELRG
jgi:rhodanese-related sulfurtransferase